MAPACTPDLSDCDPSFDGLCYGSNEKMTIVAFLDTVVVMIWSRINFIALFGLVGLAKADTTFLNESTAVPKFHLNLTPSLVKDDYRLHGKIVFNRACGSNETLVVLPKTIASVASAQYGASGLTASDKTGALPLDFQEVAQGPFGLPTQQWTPKRATEGPVSIEFTAKPASVNVSALPGPHFDLRNATGGLTGSMWALVPVPNPLSGDNYNITVSWNISAEQSAAYTWADGVGPHSHNSVGPVTRLTQTYFIVGDVKGYPSMPTSPDGKFGIYWLEKTPFDIEQVGQYLQNLLSYSTKFWQDNSTDPYRVFIRINEEQRAGSVGTGAGGTALLRSFLFGYNRDAGLAQDRVITLLAHEMTHNWTPWSSGTNAEQSRYNEGGAEFWSLRLLWRAGMLTTDQYLNEMNTRAVEYYTNPTVNFTDEKAQEVAWEIRDAQRIPYGRGMLHFANIDAQMRAKYNGTQKLDNLAIPFLQTCQLNGNCGGGEWFPLLKSSLGQEAVDDWNKVTSGQPLIKLAEGSLGPCFEVSQNGTSPVVYVWKVKEGLNTSNSDCLI
uniref:Peptidase m61 domain-containing protein n=2 Tax=Colletotrichum fructicola (strain Nara gc5) TaxID=1213859 RepID=L2GHF6_COLFN